VLRAAGELTFTIGRAPRLPTFYAAGEIRASGRGEPAAVWLPIDSKYPVEDYQRARVRARAPLAEEREEFSQPPSC
jgi:hypothetical protein